MTAKRKQLTLFVDEQESEAIESIRKKFNPQQYQLIKSHVTLCREDELEDIDKVLQTLSALDHNYITINFGSVIRFSEGAGVLMPAIGDNEQFHNLRKSILKEVTKNPRTHQPHITLMHPRNSFSTDDLFEQIQKIKLPSTLQFKKISFIQQEEGSQWKILQEFDLKK